MRLATRLLLIVTLSGLSGAARAGPCPSAGAEIGVIAGVGPRLELKLADGRTLRLAGLDPAAATPERPDLDETARAALARRLDGQPVTYQLVAQKPDRWGRWPAFAFVEGAGEGGGLTALAIAEGHARYLSEPAAKPCRDALLAAEQKARAAKLGLWADPYYGVLAVDDRAAFAERSGSNVLAEGLLRIVVPSPYRTTLRFNAPGTYGGHMLVATIPPRLLKTFKAEGLEPGTLIGKRLRFRGLLDMRFGPRIELAAPDDIEVVEAAAPAPPH